MFEDHRLLHDVLAVRHFGLLVVGHPAAPGSAQPKMPDGSHGFSMGRGQPVTAPKAP